jgi:hypothetical protein
MRGLRKRLSWGTGNPPLIPKGSGSETLHLKPPAPRFYSTGIRTMKKTIVVATYGLLYAVALLTTTFFFKPGQNPFRGSTLLEWQEMVQMIAVFPLGIGALFVHVLHPYLFVAIVVAGYAFYLIHLLYTLCSENAKRRYPLLIVLLIVVLCFNVRGCAMVWKGLEGIH